MCKGTDYNSVLQQAAPLAAFVPFPTGALPEPLASFVRQGAAALGCDETYLALRVLSVVAAAVGNSRTVRLKSDWTEPSVIWTVIIGDSSTVKSPALKLAVRPPHRLQQQLRWDYQHDMHGIVCEWCLDWYDKDFYATSPERDPLCLKGSPRVVRGGSWSDYAAGSCRSAIRSVCPPGYRVLSLGFRVALVPAR